MFNRRDFLKRSSLLAAAPLVPGFVANTALAAEAGKDTVLVILEMTGGNDGLNAIAPFKDEDYQKARSSLRITAGNGVKFTNTPSCSTRGCAIWIHSFKRARSPWFRELAIPIPTARISSRWTAGRPASPARRLERSAGWPARSPICNEALTAASP